VNLDSVLENINSDQDLGVAGLFLVKMKSTKFILKDSPAKLYLPESDVIMHSVAVMRSGSGLSL
jgi:hypothetical protein